MTGCPAGRTAPPRKCLRRRKFLRADPVARTRVGRTASSGVWFVPVKAHSLALLRPDATSLCSREGAR